MKHYLATALLYYFRFFARLQLRKVRPQHVIGVTGSAGKTSTCTAIRAILQNTYQVKFNQKANSETGIPLDILGLTPSSFTTLEWLLLALRAPLQLIFNWEKPEVYIVEMGIDSPLPPKNMEYLLSIIQPDIGVFLNAQPTHSETFDFLIQTDDPKKRIQELIGLIAKEKGKIVTKLPPTAHAVIGVDQPELASLLSSISASVQTFGNTDIAQVRIAKYTVERQGTTIHLSHNTTTATLFFANQALPKHFCQTAAAAVTTAMALTMPFLKACEELTKNYVAPRGRSSFIPACNGATILDSSYNASTQPTLDMLELLSKLPARKRIVLFGDMRELGAVSQVEHQRVADKIVHCCDMATLVGPLTQKYVLPILKKAKVPTKWFSNAYMAADYLKTQLEADDLLLVKASQNTLLLEIAVERLMAHPENADKLLARRGAFWDARRKELA